MREIKFRAWDKSAMVVVDHITWGNGVDGLSEVNHEMPRWFNLMQYTGLKDKNGVEIYEGDILTPCHYKKITFANCIVIFKKGMFCFKICKPFISEIKPLYKSMNLGRSAGNDYEVIGNIYENPELLEGE